MSSGTLLIVVVTGILGILSGWLIPIIFKSKRPYGVLGDILALDLGCHRRPTGTGVDLPMANAQDQGMRRQASSAMRRALSIRRRA
jgi:hypothetical protein